VQKLGYVGSQRAIGRHPAREGRSRCSDGQNNATPLPPKTSGESRSAAAILRANPISRYRKPAEAMLRDLSRLRQEGKQIISWRSCATSFRVAARGRVGGPVSSTPHRATYLVAMPRRMRAPQIAPLAGSDKEREQRG